MRYILIVYLTALNIAAFIMYGADKKRAVRDEWRISEKTLMLTAAAGGAAGALLAMELFRHKTKHKKFVFGVRAMLLLWVALAVKILR